MGTYDSPVLLDGSIGAVHLAVEAARVAQVVAGAVASPQRRRHGATVDALAALRVVGREAIFKTSTNN